MRPDARERLRFLSSFARARAKYTVATLVPTVDLWHISCQLICHTYSRPARHFRDC